MEFEHDLDILQDILDSLKSCLRDIEALPNCSDTRNFADELRDLVSYCQDDIKDAIGEIESAENEDTYTNTAPISGNSIAGY